MDAPTGGQRWAVGADPSEADPRFADWLRSENLREVYARACSALCAQLHSTAPLVRISLNSFLEVLRPTPAAELTKVTGAVRLRFRSSLVPFERCTSEGFGE